MLFQMLIKSRTGDNFFTSKINVTIKKQKVILREQPEETVGVVIHNEHPLVVVKAPLGYICLRPTTPSTLIVEPHHRNHSSQTCGLFPHK